MYLHSRRRIRMRGVVADTVIESFWMPDASIRKVNAVVLGATNFARVGKREVLDWPPQTIFAEFNQEFLRSELARGTRKSTSCISNATGPPQHPHAWRDSQMGQTLWLHRSSRRLGVRDESLSQRSHPLANDV